METRLFDLGVVPECSTVQFFTAHGWVPPEHQAGHAERTAMTAALVRDVVAAHRITTVTDLGCGDGSLLQALRDLPAEMWGFDAGTANVRQALAAGLDVRQADILTDDLEIGELVVCTEVLEHLADPHGWLAALDGDFLVASSPSAETADWHYRDHCWAWDLPGYAALLAGAGWDVQEQRECDGGTNWHCGVTRPQRFQAISAARGG